jgi:hypothetical protein
MDQGGREYMKFILKDNLIHIVENHGLPNNNTEVIVSVEPGIYANYNMSYSINSSDYAPIKNQTIVLKEDALKHTQLVIKIKAVKDKEVQVFTSDTIPLTHAIIFGKTLEESYPKIIQDLIQENKRIRAFIGLTEKDLKKNMLEIVETFEEITKKGSLF